MRLHTEVKLLLSFRNFHGDLVKKAKAKGMKIGRIITKNVPFSDLETYIKSVQDRPHSFIMYLDARDDTHGQFLPYYVLFQFLRYVRQLLIYSSSKYGNHNSSNTLKLTNNTAD